MVYIWLFTQSQIQIKGLHYELLLLLLLYMYIVACDTKNRKKMIIHPPSSPETRKQKECRRLVGKNISYNNIVLTIKKNTEKNFFPML